MKRVWPPVSRNHLFNDKKLLPSNVEENVVKVENVVEKVEPKVVKVENVVKKVVKVENIVKVEPKIVKVENVVKIEPKVEKIVKIEPKVEKVIKVEPKVEKVIKVEPKVEKIENIRNLAPKEPTFVKSLEKPALSKKQILPVKQLKRDTFVNSIECLEESKFETKLVPLNPKFIEIICITVSTKYDDILKLIIPNNKRFFKKWYIITDSSDKDTIDVIKKHPEIELVYFDFYKGSTFNKGGAINLVQEMIKDYTGMVLVMDSDIILPSNFDKLLPELLPDVIYSTEKRYDYHTLENYNKNIINLDYPACKNFVGYFQFYKNGDYFYQKSEDCSKCDETFRDLFKTRITLKKLVVKHLGKERDNWKGRKTRKDFIQ